MDWKISLAERALTCSCWTIQQGEHLAVLLQFVAQGADERFEAFSGGVHGFDVEILGGAAVSGVAAGVRGSALGKT